MYMKKSKTNLKGWKLAGYRIAYHPKKGLANLTEEEFKYLQNEKNSSFKSKQKSS